MGHRAEVVADLFRQHGFKVSIDRSQSGLVSVVYGYDEKCSDGRGHENPDDDHRALGPAMFGATAGKANLMAAADGAVSNLAYLDAAINHADKKGFRPGSHNIDSAHVGCAQQAKAESGVLQYAKQNYTALDGVERIVQRNGGVARLDKSHQEKELIWNLQDGSTRTPNPYDQKFDVDDWYLSFIDPVLAVAASVELLKSIRKTVDVRTVRIMTS